MSKKSFILLNGNISVLIFSVLRDEFSVNYSVDKILNRVLVPRDMQEIRQWVESRYIMSYRNDIRVFFDILGVSRIEDFIEITNCVSLKDTYWVKGLNSKKHWDTVSPYRNPLNKVIADYSFNRRINGKNVTGSPDFSTDGNFPKCWKRMNGEIYLLKAGSSGAVNSGNEPYSEVYACKIAKRLGIGVVDYTISDYKGVTVSKCKCMTNEKFGLISYRDLYRVYECDFERLLNSSKSDVDKKFLIDMLLLDYVTCNVDRHYGNIGIIVENSTNRVLGYSLLYDHNLSCIPYYMKDEDLEFYISDICAKDGRSFKDLFKLIDCTYVRHKLQKLVGYNVSIGCKRDRVVRDMVKIQLRNALKY